MKILPKPVNMPLLERYKHSSSNIYRCLQCFYWTSSVYLIRSHLRTPCNNKQEFTCYQSDIEPFFCENCGFETPQLLLFKKHIETCHESVKTEEGNVKQNKCYKCPFQSYSVLVWLRHMRNTCVKANNGKWFECGQYKFKTQISSELYNHRCKYKNSDIIKWINCDYCSYKSKYKCDMKRHIMRRHLSADKIKWFKCEKCDYKVKTASYLKSHISFKHSNPDEINWFQCGKCDHRTKRASHLKKHINWKHTNNEEIRWFKCEKCDHKTKSASNLKRHISNKHTNLNEINWIKCEKCDYKAKTAVHLKSHISCIHTNCDEIKWFKCEKCYYRAKLASNLKRHISRKHSNENKIDRFR